MTAVVWWAVGRALVVVLGRLLLGPIQRGREALARRRQARRRGRGAAVGLAVA
jgi:hypothetical protein